MTVNQWKMISLHLPPAHHAYDNNSLSTTSTHTDHTDHDDEHSIQSTEDPTALNDQFIGDILNEDKPDTITRLYTQNINGIKWTKEGGTWPMICDAVSAIHSDITCFTELNQDVNRYNLSNTMRKIENKFFKHSRFTGSTSLNKVPHTYKPGGTGMLIVENTVATIRRTTKDRMGRWVTAHLTGEFGRKIAIVAAYQVCQSKATGNATAVNCQIAQLMTESRSISTMPNPRTAFIEDLTECIKQFQANGESIILVGDFNDDMTDSNTTDGGMTDLSTQCQLADVFAIRLGSSTTPITYQRGTKRLDYALITPELLPAIRSAGYDPFNYRIPSDHRGFFIDFDTQLLLGYQPTALAPAAFRDFNSKHPRVVVNYISAIISELKHHNFWEKLSELRDATTPRHQLAERIDRDLSRATKHAANKVRRRYQTPWSPAFAKAWATIHYFKLAQSKRKNPQRDYSLAFIHLTTKYPHLPNSVPDIDDDIRDGIRAAYQSLKDARQHAESLREEYLEERAKLYAALEDMGNKKAVERLKRAEALSKTYRKLSYLRKPEACSGITELKVPMDPTVHPKECNPAEEYWRTERVPTKIEKLLLERNEKHFGQADGTPFTRGQLHTALQYHGDGPIAELILEGTYHPTTVDEASKLFIHHLRKRTEATLSGTISVDEITAKLKTWDERTSTSPSGTHLGHYHVLWRRHGLKSKDPRSDEIEQGQRDILEARATLMNYAMKFGYSFERWQQVVNVMIMKEPGNPQIHRLRVIHLYEADYNLLLAVKWRQAVHHSGDNRLLNEGIYGSRPGRSALDPVFMEVLQNEIYRCSMKSGITFNLDATSCYDRILASISSLASRSVGLNANVARMHTETLEKARFRLKTSIGLSDRSYCNTVTTPIHGTGQGSGNSPQVWCFISNALF